jgi:hypothetical protein
MAITVTGKYNESALKFPSLKKQYVSKPVDGSTVQFVIPQ